MEYQEKVQLYFSEMKYCIKEMSSTNKIVISLEYLFFIQFSTCLYSSHFHCNIVSDVWGQTNPLINKENPA